MRQIKQKGRVEIYEKEIHHHGDYILYWMQSAQRTMDNHALEVSIQLANSMSKPLLVAFVIDPHFPDANLRHFQFLLEGIECLKKQFLQLNIQFEVYHGNLLDQVSRLAQNAVVVVTDKGYGNFIRTVREKIISKCKQTFYVADTNVIIPVEIGYPKEAYAAYAIRNALLKQVDTYCHRFKLSQLEKNCLTHQLLPPIKSCTHLSLDDHMNMTLKGLPALKSVKMRGGEAQGLKKLNTFISNGLKDYGRDANAPEKEASSQLSPYLHFGHLSPITIYRKAIESGVPCAEFLEQLLVRRELAFNYVHYNPFYQSDLSKILPDWALETLKLHRQDPRPKIYSHRELEKAETHDPYWNAAQIQMVETGFMHNHMRMYWGKKVIEWTKDYDDAFKWLIHQNDYYQLDGRDPNGYAGIGWCFGKHDRAFKEREVFGKVRYMNAAGLKRKFDMAAYCAKNHREE